jgi:hypothetical protein
MSPLAVDGPFAALEKDPEWHRLREALSRNPQAVEASVARNGASGDDAGCLNVRFAKAVWVRMRRPGNRSLPEPSLAANDRERK